MKIAILCAALLAAPAFADDLVARHGSDTVRLANSPCASAQVLEAVPVQMRDELHAASAQLQGQSFSGCWRMLGNAVHVLYEDGDQGLIPLTDLKPELRA
jgi:hypothetical protein